MSEAEELARELARLLTGAAAELGVALSPGQTGQFLTFLEELGVWSAKVNLTAIREPRAVVLKHFVDSLALVPHLTGCTSLLDVGSGPGLPGLAVKIARPELRLVSVESRRRKVSFQEHIVRRLALSGVDIIWGHLEPGSKLLPPASVDCATSRALDLAAFLTAAAPFVAPGGRLLAMQGPRPQVPPLPAGLSLEATIAYRLPVLGDERSLVILRKSA